MTWTSIAIKKMIRQYGQEVEHKQRIETVNEDDGSVVYTYVVKEPKKGQFQQLTPMDQYVDRYGVKINADYIVTFVPDTEVSEGDLLYIDSNWVEVATKIERRTGIKVDYIELLLRKKTSSSLD